MNFVRQVCRFAVAVTLAGGVAVIAVVASPDC